jgi:hypothetical protein
MKPRKEGSLWTRPCLGTIDEYIRFNRELTDSEIISLATLGSASKVFTLADYYITSSADDNKITPQEKSTILSEWKSIWNADQRTTVLPIAIADIGIDGSYSALAHAADSATIWTPSTANSAAKQYYDAVESWRKMLFDESVSGFLLTKNKGIINDITNLSPSFDARYAALSMAEDTLRSAIMIKRQQLAIESANEAMNEALQNNVLEYIPIYRGTVQTVTSNKTALIIKGPEDGNVDVNIGDWVLMTAKNTTWNQGECYKWTGTAWVNLPALNYPEQYQAALYDILSIADLVSNTGYYGALFAKIVMSQKAAIDELSSKLIKLSTDGKIYSGAGNHNNKDTPIFIGGNGKLSLGSVFVWDGTALTLQGDITANTVQFSKLRTVNGFEHFSPQDNQFHSVGYVKGYAQISLDSSLSPSLSNGVNVSNFRIDAEQHLYIGWSFPNKSGSWIIAVANAITTVSGSWKVIAAYASPSVTQETMIRFEQTLTGFTDVSVIAVSI